MIYAPDRLLFPMRRTRPKGDPDAGWQRISWDEALDETAAAIRRIAAESGPEAVAFGVTTRPLPRFQTRRPGSTG